jgi:hypothetical protein
MCLPSPRFQPCIQPPRAAALPFSAGDFSSVRICGGDVEKFLAGSCFWNGKEKMGGVPVLFLPFLRGEPFFLHLLLHLHSVISFFEGPFFGVCAKRMCECVCDWEGLMRVYVLCGSRWGSVGPIGCCLSLVLQFPFLHRIYVYTVQSIQRLDDTTSMEC